MAAIMNRYCENDGIKEVWEAGCASLVPKTSKLRFSRGYRKRPIHRWLWIYLQL
ncbi:hypothetical protein C0J52_05861 [Blattella germanica]|nr:hypothetical protein C0J52_05861 [Blattella germanica]